jgi:spore germination cell wall hydrolase CwlJ-like protein
MLGLSAKILMGVAGVAAVVTAGQFASRAPSSEISAVAPAGIARLPMRAVFSDAIGKTELASMKPRGARTLQARFTEDIQSDAIPALLLDTPDEPAALEDVPATAGSVSDDIRTALTRNIRMAEPESMCLAEAVYFEARGESLEGQLAVAQVILNRTKDGRFAKSICGVVQERSPGPSRACQFSFVCDSRSDTPTASRAWDTAQAVAHVALQEATLDISSGALFFHTHNVNPKWRHRMAYTRTVGTHLFYR